MNKERDEKKEERLQRRREQARTRLAKETAEQKEERLRKRRLRDRARRAVQSSTDREEILQQRRSRLADETPESREARLQQMRDRLAVETPERRETRLQQMNARQAERLAAETPERREARQEQDRISHRLLFEQTSVQSKMQKFHAQLASIDVPLASQDSTFALNPPCVSDATETSTYQNYTLLLTTWTLAQYHLNYRFVS